MTRRRIQFVDLQRQHAEILDDVLGAVRRVLESGRFVLGSEVESFERELADFVGVSHAVATNSGTSALHLALLVAGVGPGDEVVTVSMTFWATVAAILYVGAKPVFVDVDPKSCTLDPYGLEAAITSRTKAVLPVHLYGRCSDMDAIKSISRSHRIAVIEDAAQAIGSGYKGRQAGALGEVGCFSFYPAKNLGAIGEGGAVVTDSSVFAERARVLRDHGASMKYRHDKLGYNYRMEAIQAAALRVKLKHLPSWNERRRDRALQYRQTLRGVDVLMPPQSDVENHHIFPVFTERRDALREHLIENGIETGIHYPVPAHLQPAYGRLGLPSVHLPCTEKACTRELSLPMHPYLTRSDVELVVTEVNRFSETKTSVGFANLDPA